MTDVLDTTTAPPAPNGTDTAPPAGAPIKCRSCDATFAEGNAGEKLAALRAHRKAEHADEPAPEKPAKRVRKRTTPRRAEQAPRTPDDELTPVEPESRSWGDRIKRALVGGGDAPAPAPRRRPGRPAKRVPTAGLFSGAWGMIGTGLVMTDADAPVGRCMQYQADVVGDALERLTKDTGLDRMLQPIAANTDAAKELGAVIALPLMVAAYERLPPEARPMLEPMMLAAARAHMIAMVPIMKRQQAEEKKWREAAADLGFVTGDDETDPAQLMLLALFGQTAQPEGGNPE